MFVRHLAGFIAHTWQRALMRLLCVAACVLPGLAAAQTYSASTTTYSWVSTTGHTTVTLADDAVTAELPLGFTFTFGSTSYTTVRIQSNGRLQFNNSATDYSGGTYPGAGVVNTMAAGYYDLNPATGGTVTYRAMGTAPNRQFVATWTNVPAYSNSALRFNFQMIVNEDGSFVYQYGAMSAAVYVGYQTTISDFVVYSTAFLPASGTAIRWSRGSILSGTVFEDANYGGGAGRSLAAASGTGLAGVTVELYNVAGAYQRSTTTGVGGSYSFTVSAGGQYHVRVASSTVASARSGSSTSLRGVLTYRTNASTGTPVAVTDFVGGTNPAVADAAAASAGATFNTTNFIYSAGLTGTAQAVTTVAVTLGTNVSALDFGFNFSTVTNTNDSGQGSLRQALTNANSLGGDASLAQAGRTAGIENLIFMISNGTGAAGLRASQNQFASGVATISPTSALPTVNTPVVIDGRTQPGFTSTPVVVLNGSGAGASVDGLQLTVGGSTVRGLQIQGFFGNGILLAGASGGSMVGGTGATDGNVITANRSRGVAVTGSGTGHAILGNRIHLNTDLGIDLGANGESVNDNTKTVGQPNLMMDTPVFTGAALTGTTLTVAGYVGATANQTTFGNARVEVFLADVTASGPGSGRTYLGFVTTDGNGNFYGQLTGVTGVTLNSTRITGTATDTANNTSEFSRNVVVTAGLTISGSVFEDRHYGGGAGRSLATSGGNGVTGAFVELYNSSGSYMALATSVSGSYSFTGLVPGTYRVRLVTGTVRSTRSGATSAEVGVLTYRTNASSGTAVAVTDQVGGVNPAVADAGAGSTGTTLNFVTGLFTSGISGTAQALAPVDLGSTDVGGVDFGVNFTTVVNTNDSGQGSLRQALANANTLGGDALLAVSGQTAGIEHVIFMIGNGSSAPGLRSSVNLFSSGVATITPTSALPSITGPLVLNAQTQPGWTSAPLVQLVGTSAGASANGLHALGSGVVLRGLVINRFANCAIRLEGTGGHTVAGNYLGVNSAGTAVSTGGPMGVCVYSPNNTVGGATAAERNVIGGFNVSNAGSGIDIGAAGGGSVVRGNHVGVGSDGVTAVPNYVGISVAATGSVTIGGASAGQGNRVSGNVTSGIVLSAGTHVVSGNVVGLASTDVALANGATSFATAGVMVSGGSSHTVGGNTAAEGNVISGNGGAGVWVAVSNVLIRNNRIGTNSAGTAAVSNGRFGVLLASTSIQVQVGAAGMGNVISGNSAGSLNAGIYVAGTYNVITANLIGTAADGLSALPNGAGGHGGIWVEGASGSSIGSGSAADGNLIAHNNGPGVAVTGNPTQVRIRANSMHSNSGLAIDLGTAASTAPNGATANDGAKTAGQPNQWMDTPVFSSAMYAGSTLHVAGYVGSAAGQTTFASARVEVFIASTTAAGIGQGRTYLGQLTTDSTGRFSGTLSVPSGITVGSTHVTGTATDTSGNTSEFASNRVVSGGLALAGTLFEDINYGGGNGRDRSTALAQGGAPVAGARVELFDSAGAFVGFTTSAANGSYSFANLLPGSYGVRVVSASVRSTRGGADGTQLGVMSFRTDAPSGAATPVVNAVGGMNASAADPTSAATGTTVNLTTHVFSAGLIGTAHALANVTLTGADLSGIDFGFNFSTITNTNDTGQGSLRQWTVNAAALTGEASLAQAGLTAGRESSIFMLRTSDPGYLGSHWRITLGTASLTLAGADSVLDGSTQSGTALGNLWAGTAHVLKVEINGNALSVPAVVLSGTRPGVRGVVINNLAAAAAALSVTANNAFVHASHLGTDATGTSLNAVGYGVWVGGAANAVSVGGTGANEGNVINASTAGVASQGATSLAVRGNFIGSNASGSARLSAFSVGAIANLVDTSHYDEIRRNLITGTSVGVHFNGGTVTGGRIAGNHIGVTRAGTAALGNTTGISLAPSGTGNYVGAVEIGGINAADANVIGGNGVGISVAGDVRGLRLLGNLVGRNDAGLGVANSGHGIVIADTSTVQVGGIGAGEANTVANNGGMGVVVTGNSQAITMRGNSIFGNTGLGIDLGNDGANANDGTTTAGAPNLRYDHPRLYQAVVGSSTLTVAGHVGSAWGQAVFGGMLVDLYVSDGDGSGFGEGKTYLGTLTADSNGYFSGTLTVTGLVAGTSRITANATTTTGASSEFGPHIATVPLQAFRNGSFETGSTAPGSFATLGVGDLSVDGWAVLRAGIDYIGSYWTAAHGSRSLDLSGPAAGGVRQTFLTVPGQTYTVVYAIAANVNCGSTIKPLQLSVSSGSSSASHTTSFNGSGASSSAMGWSDRSLSFTASSEASTVEFISGEASPCGPALDNVRLLNGVAYAVTGTVFEDVNYGGGAGRSRSGASGTAAVRNATVELYDGSGLFSAATTTDAAGSYTFAGLASGSYHVRVASQSVLSTRLGSTGSLRAVLTFKTTAASGTPVAVTDHVGGTNPTLADPTSASAGAVLNTTTYAFSAGLSGTAHAVSAVTLGSADVNGLDFGFNFNTVVNTNDNGQGSLRQAITNANALGAESSLAVSGRTAGVEHVIFMIGNGSAAAGLRSSINLFSGGVASVALSGTALASSATLHIDASLQPGYVSTPVVELNGAGLTAGQNLLELNGNSSLARGLLINRSPAAGVLLRGNSNRVEACRIGTNAAGTAALPNTTHGISVTGASNTVGGTSAGAGNLISGNTQTAITVNGSGATGTVIQGNVMGLNALGTTVLHNGRGGVTVGATASTTQDALATRIGGTTAAARNVIQGAAGWAAISLNNSSGTVIEGNYIGTDVSGSAAPSGTLADASGIAISGAANNTIGGTATGAGNVIAYNGRWGVRLLNSSFVASGNAVLGNSMHSNTNIGIDLAGDGVTVNDGAKTAGQPNLLMDHPVVTTAVMSGSNLVVSGYVGSAAGQAGFAAARVEIFVSDGDSAGFGEGRQYVGFLTSDANGNFSGTITPPTGVTVTTGSTVLTATATDSANNTSEFGPNRSVGMGISGTVFEDVNYGGGAGRNLAASGGPGLPGARVELYDRNGLFNAATTTDANGRYSFIGLAAESWHVRVVSATVPSSRSGFTSGLLPVMTYRTNSATDSVVNAVTDFVGGRDPTLPDAPAAAAGARLDPSTGVFSAGVSGIANTLASHSLASASVSGVDFGFHFTTVVNTNDSGVGSLRQAILNANALAGDASLATSGRAAGIEHVVFMMPNGSSAPGLRNTLNAFSGGVATLRPATELPAISTSLVLDAQTQPGWVLAPVLELNGSNTPTSTGLQLTGGASVVRGFIINRFSGNGGAGLSITGGSGHVVAGNYVGTNSSGTAAAANSVGINVNRSDVLLGGTHAASRNIISGNSYNGLQAGCSRSTTNIRVQGNYIGLNASGTAAVPNGQDGVFICGTGVTLGGGAAGAGNVIAGNGFNQVRLWGDGATGNVVQGNLFGTNATGTALIAQSGPSILLDSGASTNVVGGTGAGEGNTIRSSNQVAVVLGRGQNTRNRISGNSIYGSTAQGIRLPSDATGPTPNDGTMNWSANNYDMDSPVFTSARVRGTQLTVAGYVGSAPGQSVFGRAVVEVFVSDNSAVRYGAGRTLLGVLTADANGNFTGTISLASPLPQGTVLTGTATDTYNNTSEFGLNFSGLVVDMVVNSTQDDADTNPGDGLCLTASGVCTLRAAIAELNAWTSLATTPTIAFDLPGCSSAGSASCSIVVSSALPALTRAMHIDGSTQAGYSTSSCAPVVEVNGAATAAGIAGLVASGSNVTISQLIVNRFGGSGIVLSAGSSGHVVRGNHLGTNAAGGAAAPNGSHGVDVRAAASTIGGTAACSGNLISGNGASGIYVNANDTVVTGNRIGTDAAGTAAVANAQYGVRSWNSLGLTIGGLTGAAGNTISGNAWGGVYFDSGNSGVNLQGNRIGRNHADSAALGNGGSGIFVAGIACCSGLTASTIGGTASGAGNVIAHNASRGITLAAGSASQVAILGNSIHSNGSLGIDLGDDGVSANTGATNNSSPNLAMNFPVFTGAGLSGNALTVYGYIGTGTGQAAFAGARVEVFKAAADLSGHGEGQVYLGSLTSDANGQFSGTINVPPGSLSIGDSVTATATNAAGAVSSEFGPVWVSTSLAALIPAGFNAFDSATLLGSLSGNLSTRVAGVASTLDVIALNFAGTGLHPAFTGTVSLSWVDARNNSGTASGSCRSSWVDLGSAGIATFAAVARTTVSVVAPANATRVMRLKMSYSNAGQTVVACSSDAFAVLPASLSLAASDGDAATAGTTRALNNTLASGGVVHRAGRPFTVTAVARDALGAVMSAYDGTPSLAITGCVLPSGCSAGALSATSTTAVAGTYTNASVSYAEVGAITLRLTDISYADIDAADTSAATRTLQSPAVAVGRFVPDAYTLSVSTNGQLATANAACMAPGSGATFFGQGFGWASAPQVLVTARNAAGGATTLWGGSLAKLQASSASAVMAASGAGSATLSSSLGSLGFSAIGSGQASYTASMSDRFVLDVPPGTQQSSTTPSWSWTLNLSDTSEAGVSGNPTLTASVTQSALAFTSGAVFHSGRLALSAAHGDARSGVRQLVQLQRWSDAGWVTMTEDRGCITIGPQHLAMADASGVFSSSGVCAAPLTAATTTRGGRAWLALPATPAGAHGRLSTRLAGDSSGVACAGVGSTQAVSNLNLPWLMGGSSGPLALATWGRANRDAVLRRETW